MDTLKLATAIEGLPDPSSPLPYVPTGSIHRDFVEQAIRTPGAHAVSSVVGTCTYAQLELASRRLANQLIASGLAPGQVVLIHGTRSAALVQGMLAVLRAGAIFSVADCAYPMSRIQASARVIEPKLILLCDDLPMDDGLLRASGNLPRNRVIRIHSAIERSLKELSEFGDQPLAESPQDNADAYITFTSGSTGRPKGIVTGHAALPAFVRWHVRQHGLSSELKFSLLSGLSHDPMLRDVFTPLSIGATLCIPDQATVFSPCDLAAWLDSNSIAVIHLTPALGELIIAGAEQQGMSLRSLRCLFWGGDLLNASITERMATIAPQAMQVNFYGATETPQAMGHFHVVPGTCAGSLPIGRGVSHSQLLVMTESHAIAGIGETGEIWIRSPYLSKGYLKDPEQTSLKFVRNPFGRSEPLDRCYRTGDLGKYLPSGDVAFVGRSDHQIKVRGFRVEPAEIITAIERLQGITKAIVLAQQMTPERKVLVAYYVCTPDADHEPAYILESLRVVLPSYMIPTFAIRLDQFPLLPNGKPDLQSLPAPKDANRGRTGEYVAPANEKERQLVELWQDLLGMTKVGVLDSFTSLGGDSLTSLKALVRMRRLGMSPAAARGIFQGKTIRQIALGKEGIQEAGIQPEISTEVHTTLLINILRGMLLALVIADHWSFGVLDRLPVNQDKILRALSPLLNFSTPGFAIAFGMGLGYVYYSRFAWAPRQVVRTLLFAALIVMGGIFLRVGLEGSIRGWSSLDSTAFFSLFFSALLYYAVALGTAPLWFWIIARFRNTYLGCAVVVVCCFGMFRLCSIIFASEQTGLLQLVRLMLVAKFSYFNMSIGSLGGLMCGIFLRRNPVREVGGWALVLGAILVCTGGALLLREEGGLSTLQGRGENMDAWRWLFYGGIMLVLSSGVLWLVRRQSDKRTVLTTILRLVGTLGQCTFPVFLLHGYVLQMNKLLHLLHVPGWISLPLVLCAFFWLVFYLMRRLYQLYYGSMSEESIRA